jgi:hypothetical protein
VNTSPVVNHARRLLEESGLTSSHEPIDVALVSIFLERHYRLDGQLGRLATEKDDTFRLRADAGDCLVKGRQGDDPQGVQHRHVTAPQIPIGRSRLAG